jgi:hypothetical protein
MSLVDHTALQRAGFGPYPGAIADHSFTAAVRLACSGCFRPRSDIDLAVEAPAAAAADRERVLNVLKVLDERDTLLTVVYPA